MIKRANALFVLLSLSTILHSQNLVPNGDFEGVKGRSSPRPWSFINTIDYFVYKPGDIPDPVDKNQKLRKAHSGKGYAGMRIWGAYREYLQVKLTAPLKKDKKYSFRMYVAVSPYGNALAKTLCANFSKKGIALSDYTVVNKTKPQVTFTLPRSTKDSLDWFLLKGTFVAKGGERYLSVGHFTDRFKTRFYKKKASKVILHKEAYYYLDDIAVYELDDAGKEITALPMTRDNISSQPVDTAKKNYLEQEIEKTPVVVMKNIYFETAKAELLPESYDELGLLVDLLNADSTVQIEITGHTDNRGNEKDNKLLSQKRAQAIVKYLVDNGIREGRLSANGKGSEQPIATNDTEEGRQANRRVEFKVMKK